MVFYGGFDAVSHRFAENIEVTALLAPLIDRTVLIGPTRLPLLRGGDPTKGDQKLIKITAPLIKNDRTVLNHLVGRNTRFDRDTLMYTR